MSFIVNWCAQCFCFSSGSAYHSVSKKDDDGGIDEAQNWENSVKPDPSISLKTEKEREKHIEEIVNGLKRFPITAANKEIVRKHLLSLAVCSGALSRQLSDELVHCIGDKDIILEFRGELATLVCNNP